MRFLADESCDYQVIRALRSAGYDVAAVTEFSRQASDEEVIQQALRDKRILITEDKDFGHLVYAQGKRCAGVIFIRYPTLARKQLGSDVLALVKRYSDKLTGAFTTMQIGRVRIARVHKFNR